MMLSNWMARSTKNLTIVIIVLINFLRVEKLLLTGYFF